MGAAHFTSAGIARQRARCIARAAKTFCALLLLQCLSISAQTLARHNWAGSGLSAEPWWRSAIFYRINPATFQDSDGDGRGDLRGLMQRMAYLQSLSVDAIVLQSPADEDGFDDLLREATGHHIRLLISLSSADGATLANAARSWLTRGCAGIWLQVPAHADAAQTAAAVQALRKLTDSFPGQRVVVEDTSSDPAALALPGAQLVTRSFVAGVNGHTDALSLRVQLNQLSNVPLGSAPVVLLQQQSGDTQDTNAFKKILRSALFLSRGAAMLDAGQEIGFSTREEERVMRWTPTNVTLAPEADTAVEAPPPPPRRAENDYGTYVPYVAPARKPVMPSGPNLNALPGFSSVAVETFAVDDRSNVANEDADPNSLLNFFRKLSQLHHENATLRSGSILALNRDADDVLVWMRKPPIGSRASATVFVAANLGDSTKVVTLMPEFNTHDRAVSLLPLLSSSPLNVQVLQRPTAITLAPRSVVVLGSDR